MGSSGLVSPLLTQSGVSRFSRNADLRPLTLLLYALAITSLPLSSTSNASFLQASQSTSSVATAPPPASPTHRLLRTYLKTILENPESRKIWYFLLLNLAYMLVQMIWGVWTNSLGLISDGQYPPPSADWGASLHASVCSS